MPNTGHYWTDEEKEHALTMGWSEFKALHPDIGYDAWRHKRRDLINAEDEALPPTTVQVAAGYVGPTIGFFDFETTYSSQPRLLSAAVADGFGNVTAFVLNGPTSFTSLNCEAGCSHSVRLYNVRGDEWINDKFMSVVVREQLEEYSILAGWNSKLFDVPVLNGRLAFHGERPLRVQMHKDLMYLASGQFMRIGRRSLASVSEFFSSPHRKTPLSPGLWDRADHGDMEAYAKIVEHNIADVLVTRDVFAHLQPYVTVIHR